MGQPEAAANDMAPAAAKDLAHLFRGGTGGNVVILGGLSQEQVADGAAHDVGLVAGTGQLPHHGHRHGIDGVAKFIQDIFRDGIRHGQLA